MTEEITVRILPNDVQVFTDQHGNRVETSGRTMQETAANAYITTAAGQSYHMNEADWSALNSALTDSMLNLRNADTRSEAEAYFGVQFSYLFQQPFRLEVAQNDMLQNIASHYGNTPSPGRGGR